MKIDLKAPLQIFIIFENLPIVFFTAKANSTNHYNCYIPPKYVRSVSTLLSSEVTLNYNYLVDISAVDLEKTNQTWLIKTFKKISNKILMFSTYYFYWAKIRLTFFSFVKSQKHKINLNSIENLFFNANWLEREVSEMFGVYFFNKVDNRNLLLEYSCSWSPMLKDFPCEGYFESYYNFFDGNIEQVQVESVEL